MNLTRIDLKYKNTVAGCGGFSLLELLVGLAIASIAMLAVVSVFTTLTRSYTTQTASAGLQQKARAGLDYMAQNIRMAGLNPKRLSGAGIISANASSLEFNLDRNLNGVMENTDEEHIRFSFDPADRQIDEELYVGWGNESKQPLVGDVTDLTFNYFDQNGDLLDAAPDVADIRIVEIFVTVQQQPGRERRPVSRTYSSRVICRNLGL
jgi:prepilin-type N-terminal cleavage/methylation domain-containing protein